jgi:hypothetical protein
VCSRFFAAKGVKLENVSVHSVTSLLGSLGSEDDLVTLLDALAESTKREGGKDGNGVIVWLPIDWDKLFAGKMIGLGRWLVAGLQLNYADFLVVWASLIKAALDLEKEAKPEASKSPSPESSTG